MEESKKQTHLEWTYKGLHCEVIQHPALGHLCGYVDLPPEHKLFGVDADELDVNIRVHGGITYANFTDTGNYRIGFDCAHLGDYVPALHFHFPNDHHWTASEAVAETKRLATQLMEVSSD